MSKEQHKKNYFTNPTIISYSKSKNQDTAPRTQHQKKMSSDQAQNYYTNQSSYQNLKITKINLPVKKKFQHNQNGPTSDRENKPSFLTTNEGSIQEDDFQFYFNETPKNQEQTGDVKGQKANNQHKKLSRGIPPPVRASKGNNKGGLIIYRENSFKSQRNSFNIEYQSNNSLHNSALMKKLSVDQGKVSNKRAQHGLYQSHNNSRKNSITHKANVSSSSSKTIERHGLSKNLNSKSKENIGFSSLQNITPSKRRNSNQKLNKDIFNQDESMKFSTPKQKETSMKRKQELARKALRNQLDPPIRNIKISQDTKKKNIKEQIESKSPTQKFKSPYLQIQSERSLNVTPSRSRLNERSPPRASDQILLEQYQNKLQFPIKFTENQYTDAKSKQCGSDFHSTIEVPIPKDKPPSPSKMDEQSIQEYFLNNEYFKIQDKMNSEYHNRSRAKSALDQYFSHHSPENFNLNNSFIPSGNKDQNQQSFISSQFQENNKEILAQLQIKKNNMKQEENRKNKIKELKNQIQQNILKGKFDMKFIRQLETEAVIVIQRWFRRARIKKIQPIREGKNACVQTDSLSQQELIGKYKAQIVQAYIIMNMARAVQRKNKNKE